MLLSVKTAKQSSSKGNPQYDPIEGRLAGQLKYS